MNDESQNAQGDQTEMTEDVRQSLEREGRDARNRKLVAKVDIGQNSGNGKKYRVKWKQRLRWKDEDVS